MMHKIIITSIIILNFIRCFPHLLLFYFHKNKSVIHADTRRWIHMEELKYPLPVGFIYLLGLLPQFRNLFYNRIGFSAHFLDFFCPKLSSLYIFTKDIGEGFYISHGFSTGIGAKSIGKNCFVHQQVNIGFYKGSPTILDNVTIYAGAVIMGNITIGNNCVIGANATVFTDVPDNCTVIPVTSRIMKWDSKKNTY